MGRSKLPKQFGIIDRRVWDKIENFDKQFLPKYNHYMLQLEKLDNQIEGLKIEIDKKKQEKIFWRKKAEKVWKEKQHYHEAYNMKFNIASNTKYTSIIDREGFNKGGKSKSQLLEERKVIGKWWLINLKHMGHSKSIHIGKDDYVKKLIVDELGVDKKELTAKKLIEVKKGKKETLGDNNIKKYLRFLINESLEDKLIKANEKNENFLNTPIKFRDLI